MRTSLREIAGSIVAADAYLETCTGFQTCSGMMQIAQVRNNVVKNRPLRRSSKCCVFNTDHLTLPIA